MTPPSPKKVSTQNPFSPPPGTKSPSAASAPVFELRGRVAQLQSQSQSISRRNVYLTWGLGGGAILLLLVLLTIYRVAVRSYAVLDEVRVTQDTATQGRLGISFKVTAPGQVHYRRSSGSTRAELVDIFHAAGPVSRSWSWIYEPGEKIDLSIRSRNRLWRTSLSQSFPTSDHADIVVLMDTTGSMSRYIHLLKERCSMFAQRLSEHDLRYRFALLGFGDTGDGSWLDQHAFTDNVEQFKRDIESVQRFEGGDLPESSLDALEQALRLPFNEGSLRRIYLVTDDSFHAPTKSGKSVRDVAARLAETKILLNVFTMPEFFKDYAPLGSAAGSDAPAESSGNVRLMDMAKFGDVLSEGRIIED